MALTASVAIKSILDFTFKVLAIMRSRMTALLPPLGDLEGCERTNCVELGRATLRNS